jgi:hypothetical protein
MALWRFLDYEPAPSNCPVRDWYAAQDAFVQAEFDAALVTLGATDDWDDPDLREFKSFTDKPQHLGLGQVRFETNREDRKRQFRVIGLRRTEQRELILLMGFEKNGRSPKPPNAFEIALELRTRFEEGEGELHEHV